MLICLNALFVAFCVLAQGAQRVYLKTGSDVRGLGARSPNRGNRDVGGGFVTLLHCYIVTLRWF